MVEAEALGLQREFPQVGPEAVLGLEVNPYAAELARVSVWIGHIQWARRHGFPRALRSGAARLDTIACRDAVLAEDGTPAPWPAADVIVGNPPFLGGKRMRSVLGDAYCDRLFAAYAGQVPAEADLVCYWFVRAQEAMADEASAARRPGGDEQHPRRREPARAGADRARRAPSRPLGRTSPGCWTARRCACHWCAGGASRATAPVLDGIAGARDPRRPDRGRRERDDGAAAGGERRCGVSWATPRAAPSMCRASWRAHGWRCRATPMDGRTRTCCARGRTAWT